MKVYGPYTKKKDGRQHVVIIFDDNTRRTVSYPKYLVEQRLGRVLDPDEETIDHIDGNFNNNDWNNLRIKDRSSHLIDDVKRVKYIRVACPLCNKVFRANPGKIEYNINIGKAGPFCSRRCSGIYGMNRRYYNSKKLVYCSLIPLRRYYSRKDKWFKFVNDTIVVWYNKQVIRVWKVNT
jgi:hypothetical protein